MEPINVFQQLLKLNRPAAVFLLAGIAVFASAAIVTAFKGIDVDSAAITAAYVLVFAFVVLLLIFIINDPTLRAVLGWFVTLLFILWASSISVSIMVPGLTALPRAACLLQFWKDCPKLLDTIADQKFTPPAAPVSPTVAAPAAPVPYSNFQVFVQFAGVIRREDIRSLMQTLQSEGWNVQGVNGGGQRTGAAAGYNEIRYFGAASLDAAKALARRVQAANITTEPITVVNTASLKANTLEVWISR